MRPFLLLPAPLLAVGVLLSVFFPTGREEPPIELKLSPYAGPLRTLTATIAGRDEAMLFDSGGGATVLTPTLLARLGATPFGRGTGFRHDGTRVDGQRGGPVTLAIGAFAYRDEVGVIALDKILGGLPPVGGITSLHTFADQLITLDLAGNRLVVETAESLPERVRGAKELQMRIARPAAGAGLDVFVAVEGEHGPQWFELDCGNAGPVLVAPHAWSEVGLAGEPAATPETRTLRLRGLGEVSVALAAKEMIYDGLLNAAFCERHVLTLDLRSGRAWARTR
jgi:hypothetical protein